MRTDSIQRKIKFDELFGSGSMYTSGAETLFLNEARKMGLQIYESPKYIADVDFSSSTWFEGFNYKFFRQRGNVEG